MTLTQTCLICGYENERGNLRCAGCGASLEGSDPTPVLPAPLGDDAVTQAKKEDLLKQTTPGQVTLHIAGKHKPIVIRETGRIILGRKILADDKTKIDLNPFDAHSLGVSRQHAVLNISEGGCTLEDLGSTNGTWINETQLKPNEPHSLHNGDLIRLGYLLMIVLLDKQDHPPQKDKP